MEAKTAFGNHLNLKATELRLGLPGTEESDQLQSVKNNKRSSSEMDPVSSQKGTAGRQECDAASAPK